MARILAQVGLRAEGSVAPRLQPAPWYLWPCNGPVWELWQGLQTQWQRAGMAGQPTGLDYAAVWATLSGLRVRKPREVFGLLQAMERAALDAWAERRAREPPPAGRR